MKRIVSLLAFGALVTQSVAISASPPQSPSPGGGKDEAGELVCKSQSVVGSRLAVKKKCLTKAEWASERKTHKEAVEAIQRPTGSVCTSKTGC